MQYTTHIEWILLILTLACKIRLYLCFLKSICVYNKYLLVVCKLYNIQKVEIVWEIVQNC